MIIFRCYIMGDKPIKIEQFFKGFKGVIMGSIMGSQNIMCSDYGSNISGTACWEYTLIYVRMKKKKQHRL
jgi:hypothetical protein